VIGEGKNRPNSMMHNPNQQTNQLLYQNQTCLLHLFLKNPVFFIFSYHILRIVFFVHRLIHFLSFFLISNQSMDRHRLRRHRHFERLTRLVLFCTIAARYLVRHRRCSSRNRRKRRSLVIITQVVDDHAKLSDLPSEERHIGCLDVDRFIPLTPTLLLTF
jgi:hypothetical protein